MAGECARLRQQGKAQHHAAVHDLEAGLEAQCWTVGALMTMVAGTGIWVWAAQWGYWVSLLLTVVSGVNYVWKARAILFR